ncbi:hypothetical protein BJ912DRAFT_936451 [Pholiota molesta]|nr:hypothetical protein BJ912DRAFT_936448 [Pholiota molesta]KAF8158717.1 hypothetical protein BJ912DRAFT_936451 [Pholiota molesta]
MSSASEFESTQCTLVAHSPSSPKRRKTSLRTRSKGNHIDIPSLFAPGGILDSQTTDSQWAELHFGSETSVNFEDSQTMGYSQEPDELETQLEESSAKDPDCSSTHPNIQELQTPESDEYLLKQVINIIDLCTTNAIRNLDLPRKDDEIKKLRARSTILEAQVDSLTARNAMLCREISQEREWIHLLEQTLQHHCIAYPEYPVRTQL